MKTKLQRILSICVLVTCIMAPFAVFAATTYINCLTCLKKTARLEISYTDGYLYDEACHWKEQWAFSYCENPNCADHNIPVFQAGQDTTHTPHNHSINVGSTCVSVTNLNASQHQRKYKDTKKCNVCEHTIASYRTVNQSHSYKMQSQTKSNGYITTTYKCTGCGRINVVKSRTR